MRLVAHVVTLVLRHKAHVAAVMKVWEKNQWKWKFKIYHSDNVSGAN